MGRSDAEIRDDVVRVMAADARIGGAGGIHATVEDGIVTLGGVAPSYLAREAARQDARAVAGVRGIDDHVVVRYPGTAVVPPDAELRANAERVLAWSHEIDASAITVEVARGVVMVRGSVDAYWKRVHAEQLVAPLAGVIAIRNELAVVPTASIEDERIAGELMAVLERNAVVDPATLDVRVEEGTVTLIGTVPSWAAREAAIHAAVRIAGVTNVIDHVAVAPWPP